MELKEILLANDVSEDAWCTGVQVGHPIPEECREKTVPGMNRKFDDLYKLINSGGLGF